MPEAYITPQKIPTADLGCQIGYIFFRRKLANKEAGEIMAGVQRLVFLFLISLGEEPG